MKLFRELLQQKILEELDIYTEKLALVSTLYYHIEIEIKGFLIFVIGESQSVTGQSV